GGFCPHLPQRRICECLRRHCGDLQRLGGGGPGGLQPRPLRLPALHHQEAAASRVGRGAECHCGGRRLEVRADCADEPGTSLGGLQLRLLHYVPEHGGLHHRMSGILAHHGLLGLDGGFGGVLSDELGRSRRWPRQSSEACTYNFGFRSHQCGSHLPALLAGSHLHQE
ncbi:unnamed protein product, partial [Effrenium voratum]